MPFGMRLAPTEAVAKTNRRFDSWRMRKELQDFPEALEKRETGIEPAIFALARRRSTTLLLAHIM